jgi:hypothetical protein
MDNEQFLLEIQRLHFEMERCITKYNMQDHVVSLMVTGVLDSDDEDDPMLKAILSFHIHSEPVLEEVFDFVRDAFRKSESDGYTLDDMLGEAGIVTDDE